MAPVGDPTYLDYEPIADDNQASPPIGMPEGNFAGKFVNDILRHMAAVIRKLGDGVLQLDGTTKPTADIDFNTKRILNIGSQSNSRLAATRNDQLQEEPFTWGGTTTGSGAAYVVALTPSFTGSVYRAGQRVRFLAHATSTSTTPTLDIGTPGPATMKHRDGSALQVGSLQIGHRYEAEWDGSAWRVLDAGGYMEQALYDTLWPVNGPMQIRHDDVDPNTQLPGGIVATWTELNLDEATATALALRDSADVGSTEGTDVSGGHALTAAENGPHDHFVFRNVDGDGTQVDAAHAAARQESAFGDDDYKISDAASGAANVGLSSSSGNGSAHTHPNNNRVLIVRAWRRSA